MTAVNAGHNVHLDEPLLVVQAIRDLVDRCRELRAECRAGPYLAVMATGTLQRYRVTVRCPPGG